MAGWTLHRLCSSGSCRTLVPRLRQQGAHILATSTGIRSLVSHHANILSTKATSLKTFHGAVSMSTTSAMASSKLQMADRIKGTDKNVWVEFGKLVVEHNALNLGQGFPDFFPPKYIQETLAEVALKKDAFMNQYTRSYGHPRLVKALSDLYSPIMDHQIDPNTDILITVGAYGSLFCAVQGLVNPGDEVIIIEPYFDCYEPMVRVAGGTPVFVPLKPTKSGSDITSGDWKLDPDELASKFNEKTKAIFFNTPNNPLGKVYTYEEMEVIADLCKKHDVIVFSDEVYEWLVYNENKHIKMATLPDMWDRTITIGSAGKTFSVTGWKIGWAIGPPTLIHAMQTVHQNCVYTCPTPIQEAVAIGFEKEMTQLESPNCYFNSLAQELQPKLNKIANLLREIGMVPVVPQGGYFIMADFSNFHVDLGDDSDETKDFKFVKWMIKTKKISAIPPSAFYSGPNKHLAENLIRLCFIKEDATLEKAAEIFKAWKATL